MGALKLMSINSLRVAAIGMASIVLFGCAETRFVGRPELTVVQQAELPAPHATDLVSEPREQVLGPFDQVSVDVFGLPELSRTVIIDRSGRVALPLIGSLEASGRTPQQLSDSIQQRLRENHVREPRVAVNVTQVVSQVVTVDGAVRTPGIYPVTGRMTLMRAIARAQGAGEFARENHVIVFRRVGGRDMAALYDLRAIRAGMYADPEIFANDVVLVSESRARRLFRDLVQSSGVLVAPLVTLLQ